MAAIRAEPIIHSPTPPAAGSANDGEEIMATKKWNMLILWGDDMGTWNVS